MLRSILISLLVTSYLLCDARPQLGQVVQNQDSRYPSSTTPIPIVTQYSTSDPDGSFNVSYETGNGIKVQNSGYIKTVRIPRHEDENGKIVEEHDEQILVQSGLYSYTDPEGNLITVTYVADENGFQPSGDHLPKPPAAINYQELNRLRPTQQNQLGQGITNIPASANFQQFPTQERNSQQQQQQQQQQFFQQFPQPQFSQGRFRRQIELHQERPIQSQSGHQLHQDRHILPYQPLGQEKPTHHDSFPQGQPLHQDRHILPYQPLGQEKPIHHDSFPQGHQLHQDRHILPYQPLGQEKPIHHDSFPQGQPLHQDRQILPYQPLGQEKPIHHNSFPQGQPLHQDRQILPYQPLGQEKLIHHDSRSKRQVLNQERPIEQGPSHQEIPQERPIQSLPGQPLRQDRPILPYQPLGEEKPVHHDSRSKRQVLHQERPNEQGPSHQEIPQERPIQSLPGQPLRQDRPILPYQPLGEEKPIHHDSRSKRQVLHQERPIEQGPSHQEIPQERPIQSLPGQPLRQDRPILPYQPLGEEKLIHHDSRSKRQVLHQERPIEQGPSHQEIPQERPIQSLPGQPLHQDRPILPYQPLGEEKPIHHDSRSKRQVLHQERPIEQGPSHQEIPQERPIQSLPGQPLHQNRPILRYQPLGEEKPIHHESRSKRQVLHQERPIEQGPSHQEIPQERPIQSLPGQPLRQDRPILPYQPLGEEKPIHHDSRSKRQVLHQERPIEQGPSHQEIPQERPIQALPGKPLRQDRPIFA